MDVKDSAIMCFLREKNQIYFGKVLELRETVGGWLAYIPRSFPHYTRHTMPHSEEIVWQLSKMLFRENSAAQPVLRSLSGVEAYILIVASYLHDSGMVVSDSEIAQLLVSPEWKEWITSGGGTKRFEEISAFREADQPSESSVRFFLADVQLRYLVAEFIRRNHHLRALDVIMLHQSHLGRFGFDDPILIRTIADVCIAHGLRLHELEDRERYPYERDIRGEGANVRLLAILLRIGDLLDLSSDRACPMLQNAANPLPPGSLAHWSQYKRITHRVTTPERVEISAECSNQDEHRILQDWCTWLVDELHEAAFAMSRAPRHGEWKPPYAKIEGSSPSISIKPSNDANYFPSDWVFELDHHAVFERLIHAYDGTKRVFVRELIQNAADASRCKLYSDLKRDTLPIPPLPTEVAKDRRDRYPIRIELKEESRTNELSSEVEQRQILSVEDLGIGMDEDVIKRYFLQVGRSFYDTDEFRRTYPFTPTSRFGVGFLSTFSESDEILVETFKPESVTSEGPIRLKLTGPRSYLLTEKGSRKEPGTCISVTLKEPLKPGELTQIVQYWCKRLEFPVEVHDLSSVTVIEAEKPELFLEETVDLKEKNAKFVIKSFPLNVDGVKGELYVFTHLTPRGDSWADHSWARHQYLTKHPEATIPSLPGQLTCFHGIAVHHYPGGPASNFCIRCDYRGVDTQTDLRRSRFVGLAPSHFLAEGDNRIAAEVDRILGEHLSVTPHAKGENEWRYRQRLILRIGSEHFWRKEPRTLQVHEASSLRLISLDEAIQLESLTVLMRGNEQISPALKGSNAKDIDLTKLKSSLRGPLLLESELEDVSSDYRKWMFSDKSVTSIKLLQHTFLAVRWERKSIEPLLFDESKFPIAVLSYFRKKVIGSRLHVVGQDYEKVVFLNRDNSFSQWLLRVRETCLTENQYGLRPEHFSRLMALLQKCLRYSGLEHEALNEYLSAWCQLPLLPASLKPTLMAVKREMFFNLPRTRFSMGKFTKLTTKTTASARPNSPRR